MKIGLLYSGIYWQEYGFKSLGWAYEKIYIYSSKVNLEKYDIIIVPKGIHQEFLKDNQGRFVEFMQQGGILVSFGEVDGNWLPETKWEQGRRGDKIHVLAKDSIFGDVNDTDFEEWTKAVHGYFSTIPHDSKIVACIDGKGNENKIVCYINDSLFGEGAILATTMDPDYHTYSKIPSADKVFTIIIEWSQMMALKIRERMKRSRRLAPPKRLDSLRKFIDIKGLWIEILVGIIISVLIFLLKIKLF